ncbi:thioredoxin family protein [Aerococcus mictus]|uniref:thioredoxin family protein n=1 Tax=Aerococcus mictus TaxID=2976810 RepID=UPI000DCC856F|nr:thioredoxin domain-containing protein [Aerococcus mictus]KAA9233697.1 thioredoxin [Aerococcus mictus]MDL5183804.1 thioredoxin domain-containing protein [Aerococcus mictus]
MIKELEKDTFKEDLQNGTVLVDFYSKTCGPCKMLSFILDDVDKTKGDDLSIIKISFEENPDLVEEYGVEGYPTLIAFKDGEEVTRKAGLQQKPVILKMIEAAE